VLRRGTYPCRKRGLVATILLGIPVRTHPLVVSALFIEQVIESASFRPRL
jgi:hypothetical protein